jgi:hypothetical protein
LTVFALRIVTWGFTEELAIFDQRALLNVFRGADQKITLPE